MTRNYKWLFWKREEKMGGDVIGTPRGGYLETTGREGEREREGKEGNSQEKGGPKTSPLVILSLAQNILFSFCLCVYVPNAYVSVCMQAPAEARKGCQIPRS